MSRNFEWYFINGYISNTLIWIRVGYFKHGIAIKKTPMLFSERNGYTKFIPLWFGWRVSILKAYK